MNRLLLSWRWCVLAACLTLAACAITSQSFWIDEGNSGLKAIQSTWSEFVGLWVKHKGSDLQMPGYMIGLWGWEKLFGPGEYALRASNLPWFALAIASILFLLRQPARVRLLIVGCFASSAFVWAYLDEARPYSMQLGAATLAVVGLVNLASAPGEDCLFGDALCFLGGSLLLCFSSLFGVIFSFVFGIAFLWVLLRQGRTLVLLRNHSFRLGLALFIPLFAALAFFYAWTLMQGAGASSVARTGVMSIGFASNELLGLAGYGPGRTALREHGAAVLKPYLPWLTLGLCPYFVAGWSLLRRYLLQGATSLRQPGFLLGVMLLGVTAGIIVGLAGHFRVLGRHLTPMLPVLLILLGLAFSFGWEGRQSRTAVVLSLLVLLGSSVWQRTGRRFGKDDYRTAAAMAHEVDARGGTVWWAADGATARFYGIEPTAGDGPGQIFHTSGCSPSYLAKLPPPALVVFSKPDIYDGNGALASYLAENDFRPISHVPSFVFWSR